MGIELYEHNLAAYSAAVLMLNNTGKAAIIHPTGTGKSFIGFKLCEDNPDKVICWLSPSDYIFKTQLENLKQASAGFEPTNIKFFTYAKLMNMDDASISEIRPDYIILDEFHRCGAEMWGQGVQALLHEYKDVPLLGMSATAIRYLDNQRDMAEELFSGNIASEMTLGEAIVRGILNPPTYIVSMFSYQKELEEYEKKIKQTRYASVRGKAQEYIDELRRALQMADGIDEMFRKHMKDKTGKYIVFCSGYEHMQEMLDFTEEWFSGIDENPHIYTAYSDDPETSQAFADFKSDESNHLKLLYCIDMLNEGIHVEGVSGVILLRPTVSPIVYKQQIGRALSASKQKEPIIFDIVNNFENLYSISSIQEEMQVAMTYYRDLGDGDKIVNERFKIVDKVRSCKEIFEQLEDTLSISWELMFSYAKRYFEEHGTLEVPKRHKTDDGYSLGNWIITQRKVYSGEQFGKLSEEQINKLNKIGMRWGTLNDVSWDRFYEEAKKYYKENGTLDVGLNCTTANGYALGKKICQIRSYRKCGIKSSYVTEERIKALDEIGMIWSVPDVIWERNYLAALEFFMENGHLDPPNDYVSKNGVRVGAWITRIRGLRSTGSKYFNLTEEQIKKLDDIGMMWTGKYERMWMAGYREAKKYFEKYGDLNVSTSYITADGFKLGDWIENQREAKKKIKPERKELLDGIGMLWEKEDPWEAKFKLAEDYFRSNGDLRVPSKYVVEGVWLNKWLNEQKQRYLGKRAGKKLSKEQIKRLEAIGINWA